VLLLVSKSESLVHFSIDYAGDNFVRRSGDAQKHSMAQVFAYEAHETGVDGTLLAEPTKMEILQKEHEKKSKHIQRQLQKSIVQRYGGDEHVHALPKLAQAESYVEYSRHGKVIKVSVELITTIVIEVTSYKIRDLYGN
jgi:pre-mRNA-processing factor SLU7